VSGDPTGNGWSGHFQFSSYQHTLTAKDRFFFNYKGSTPPPSFYVKVSDTANLVLIEPSVEIHLSESTKDTLFGSTVFKYYWWGNLKGENGHQYVVSLMVAGQEVASDLYTYKASSSGGGGGGFF
jgi:hypothetical protein